jgi:hypothetical protein
VLPAIQNCANTGYSQLLAVPPLGMDDTTRYVDNVACCPAHGR